MKQNKYNNQPIVPRNNTRILADGERGRRGSKERRALLRLRFLGEGGRGTLASCCPWRGKDRAGAGEERRAGGEVGTGDV